ncbi:NAD-binding protein [Fomitopsis schrenkii]|uniref:NAD-binding protein n=1 Tax=Fomitopsis schrenkii TaxID=2126942 RepID=S8E2Y8_FOMSC|nr:NAD-binding protein [Fomitopsis schrenkii]
MDITTWLITGASRGLGLGLTRSLSASPSNIVIATCRNLEYASELNALQVDVRGGGQDNLHIVQLDVSDEASTRASVAAVERALGGTGPRRAAYLDGAFDCDYGHMMAILKTNVVAPALLGKAYLPLLDLGTRKTIVNVSSARGSIGGCFDARNAVYSLSKSALNMLVRPWCAVA